MLKMKWSLRKVESFAAFSTKNGLMLNDFIYLFQSKRSAKLHNISQVNDVSNAAITIQSRRPSEEDSYPEQGDYKFYFFLIAMVFVDLATVLSLQCILSLWYCLLI